MFPFDAALTPGVGGGDVSPGAGSENQGLPGADRLFELQVQDADDESQARHHAADGDGGGGAGRGDGGPGPGAPPRDLGPPLGGHGKSGRRPGALGAARSLLTAPWRGAPVCFLGLVLGISASSSCRLGLRNSLLNSPTTFGPRPVFDTENSDS